MKENIFVPAAHATHKHATPSVVSGHVNLSGSNVQTLSLIAFVAISAYAIKKLVDKATSLKSGE